MKRPRATHVALTALVLIALLSFAGYLQAAMLQPSHYRATAIAYLCIGIACVLGIIALVAYDRGKRTASRPAI
jgi:hypothetical protein